MDIKNFISSNLERYSQSPYEIGDKYLERVELYTRDVEFDSREEYVLVASEDSDTWAEEKLFGSKSYIRINGDEFVWEGFVSINEASIALYDILYAVRENKMSAEEAVRRVFPEARRAEH